MSREVRVPDMGDVPEAEVIEVFVDAGQSVRADEALVTLESDKAAMDLPAPFSGTVEAVHVALGDIVTMDTLVATLTDAPVPEESATEPESEQEQSETSEADAAPEPEAEPQPVVEPSEPPASLPEEPPHLGNLPHAGPAIRKFARELGVDLAQVHGHGRRGRITREDVQQYVKAILTQKQEPATAARPKSPPVDAERFGPCHREPLTRIQRRSGANLQRNWQLAPHVTQHHEADITALDEQRRDWAQRHPDLSITLTACVIRACAQLMSECPRINAALSEDGKELIVRDYIHIGFAANTEAGLVVPVIRDADSKPILTLAQEVAELAERARAGELVAADMQGGGFTLSNLGGIGGGSFTPVINLPQVAVLGISRAVHKPGYIEDVLEPRLMMPLSLSYDHRVIDGVEGARFVVALTALLETPQELEWSDDE